MKESRSLEVKLQAKETSSSPGGSESLSEAGAIEGGWAGWATLLGAFLVQFCTYGLSTSFGVYEDFYLRIYLPSSTPSSIAWIGSVNCCLGTASGLLVGRLYDRGYFYHLMIGGAFLCSLSLFMLSFARHDCFYQVFLTQGIGLGLGTGAMYVPSFAIVSHHFHRHRMIAMSIVACGTSFGAVLHPIMLNNTLNGRLGFSNATRLLAGIVSLLLGLACCLMRTRPLSVKPLPLGVCLQKFCGDGAYIAILFGAFFFCTGYNYPIFFLQLDAIKHGMSKHFAFYVLVILSASNCVGRLITGIFVRKIALERLAILSVVCCGLVIFAMIGVKGIPDIVTIAILYGFFSGIYMSLNTPLFALLADNAAEIGLRMGVGLTFVGVGLLLGGPIQGATLGEDYVWWRPALCSGVACATSSFLFLLATLILYRRRKAVHPAITTDSEAVPQEPTRIH